MNDYELNKSFYKIECKLALLDTRTSVILDRIYEVLENVNKGLAPFNKEIREKYGIPLRDEESAEVSGTTFTHWDNETRREHGLPLKDESEVQK